MPDFVFHCVACGRRLCASAEAACGVTECPHCLHMVPVPSFGAAQDYLGCPLPAFPPEILGVEMKFLCEKCRVKLKIDVRLQDREVPCPRCAATIRVPRLRAEPPPRPAAAALLSLAETEFLSGLDDPPPRTGAVC